MPTQINSDKILIKDVFQQWYRVPEYQRPYVWGADEVSDLLEDVTDALETRPGSQYFLGSIVFQTQARKDTNGSAYEEHDLLDGQQRLMTCLNTQDVYGQRYGTYILYKVDLLFGGPHHRLQPPLQISIEHILPQSPATTSQWQNDFTATDREQWTHRLGNLVLIGRRKNTSLGRLDFIDKKQRYFQNHIQPFPNSLRVMNQNSQWTLFTLQASHQAVLDALRAHYQ